MGDPKKPKKKFSMPSHPWKKERIEFEGPIKKEYGLKNKKEIWKLSSVLKRFAEQAKASIVTRTKQAELEKENMVNKLVKMGLIKPGGQIDDILSLTINDICERRLQTLVMKKGFARTTKQARQFIVHRHISIGDRKITAPGYLVSMEEESLISFSPRSSLSNVEHPERTIEKKEQKA